MNNPSFLFRPVQYLVHNLFLSSLLNSNEIKVLSHLAQGKCLHDAKNIGVDDIQLDDIELGHYVCHHTNYVQCQEMKIEKQKPDIKSMFIKTIGGL